MLANNWYLIFFLIHKFYFVKLFLSFCHNFYDLTTCGKNDMFQKTYNY